MRKIEKPLIVEFSTVKLSVKKLKDLVENIRDYETNLKYRYKDYEYISLDELCENVDEHTIHELQIKTSDHRFSIDFKKNYTEIYASSENNKDAIFAINFLKKCVPFYFYRPAISEWNMFVGVTIYISLLAFYFIIYFIDMFNNHFMPLSYTLLVLLLFIIINLRISLAGRLLAKTIINIKDLEDKIFTKKNIKLWVLKSLNSIFLMGVGGIIGMIINSYFK